MANVITVSRVLILFGAVGLIGRGEWRYSLAASGLILLVILLDWADGYVARIPKATTAVGAVMDILADRIVENVLWIVFAFAGVVPLWVPLVVLVRGLVTDAVRSIALRSGKTAFGPRTMMVSWIGRALVSSKTSRALYAAMKAITFGYLALFLALIQAFHVGTEPAWATSRLPFLAALARVLTGVTVSLCVIRGVPVLIEGWRLVRAGNTSGGDGGSPAA